MKTLYDISWQVDEPTYRADPSYSYSLLSKFDREGVEKIGSLREKTESKSLRLGSAVDAILTGGEAEFNNHFVIANIKYITDKFEKSVRELFNKFNGTRWENIPGDALLEAIVDIKYQSSTWQPSTRVNDFEKRGGAIYYNALVDAEKKQVLTQEEYKNVLMWVDALRNSANTAWYFIEDSPFESETDITREYQLKFKDVYHGVSYRCMMDLAITDHKNKIVYPCDLKTSYHLETEFPESFIKWNYYHQARLYWRILRNIMDKDPYFREFYLADYRFIIVSTSNPNPNPMIWEYKDTQKRGMLVYGENNNIVFNDPYILGERLWYYENILPNTNPEINRNNLNSITDYLNKL